MKRANFTWTEPVDLELTCGLTRSFRNTYDALDFLEAEWPTRRGDAYRRATRLCRNALFSPQTTHIARIAFMAAAEEAGMSLLDDNAGLDDRAGNGNGLARFNRALA